MPQVAMRRRGRQIKATARPAVFIAGRADAGLVDHAADLLFSLFPPLQTRDEKKANLLAFLSWRPRHTAPLRNCWLMRTLRISAVDCK
jgi:hypothetical protein